MIEIKKFTATNLEFEELARIDNLVNHDSINHPDDDKRDWKIRDKSLIRDRLLLYNNQQLIGVLYYSQGRSENNRTCFYTLNLDPSYNHKGYRELLYHKMIEEVKKFNCDKLLTSIYKHPNYMELQKLLIKKKFKLVQTNREYSCDIRKVNIAKYQPLIQKLESEGIYFYDSKEEMLDWPNHYEKLEELEWTYAQDFPIPDGLKHTRPPFKHWLKILHHYYENSYGADIIAVYKTHALYKNIVYIQELSKKIE